MNDFQIRNVLIHDIKKKHPNTPTVKNLIVQEMVLCKGFARADVALVNGKMHGYEIKSSEDTLVRLNNQIDYYSKCFDYVTVVASEKHIDPLLSKYPEWIGISVACVKSDCLKIKTLRQPKKNNADIISQLQLLWKEELIAIGTLLLKDMKLTYQTKSKIIDCLVANCKKNLLEQQMRTALKERTTWSIALTD